MIVRAVRDSFLLPQLARRVVRLLSKLGKHSFVLRDLWKQIGTELGILGPKYIRVGLSSSSFSIVVAWLRAHFCPDREHNAVVRGL